MRVQSRSERVKIHDTVDAGRDVVVDAVKDVTIDLANHPLATKDITAERDIAVRSINNSVSINSAQARDDVVVRATGRIDAGLLYAGEAVTRSEERRVGKECRSRWSPYH